MKIVVTDGYTLNPGDLSWEPIRELGDLVVFDRTNASDIVERCIDAIIVLTNKVPFSRETIEDLPLLKFLSVLATGYNIIDTGAAKEKGIAVSNVPGYGTSSVAQHTFALLLELTNHISLHANSVREGKWQQSPDWCYFDAPLKELAGKTFGIIGFGNVGQQVARIAKAFGMDILYYSTHKKETDIAEFADLKTVFSQSDVVSLHCPLKPDNNQFVNKELLSSMKTSAFLLNTARGQLINEHDLADALNTKMIAGAALDVLSSEPPAKTNPLLSAKNCIITPHNAWMSREARQRIMDTTVQNIKSYIEGTPVNVVN